MTTSVEVDLFVCGAVTERSTRTVRNLTALCAERYGTHYTVNVIDVLAEPEIAERSNVIATPLAIVRRPLPARRFVGDLSDVDPDLWPKPNGPAPSRHTATQGA